MCCARICHVNPESQGVCAADGDNFGIIQGYRFDLSSYLIGARYGESESDRASG